MTISTNDFEVLLAKERQARRRAEMMERTYRQQVRAYVQHIDELNAIQRALILTVVVQQKELEEAKSRRALAENKKGMQVLNDLEGGLHGFGEGCTAAIDELHPIATQYDPAPDLAMGGTDEEALPRT